MWNSSRTILLLVASLLAVSFEASPRGQGPAATQSADATRPTQSTSGAQQPQSDPSTAQETQQPTFRAGIDFVRVDVIVSDEQGNPIADLQQSDFEVLEDGKPQTIETFKLIKIDGNPADGGEPARAIKTGYDEESEAAREDVRLFAILLDDYHVRRGNSLVIRDPLTTFIRNQLGPLDMVSLMYPLTPLSDVRMTRNHDAIVRAINQFDGRKYDYTPRNEFEDRYAMYPATVVERLRNQVTLSALKGLVIHLGALREGRKAVILVSEGFTNSLPPQLRDPIAGAPGFMNPDRNDPLAEDSTREQVMNFFNDSELQSDLRNVFNAANRSNTAIYTLDPRGLTSGEFDIDQNIGFRTSADVLRNTQDTLRVLAEQTDGRAIVNRNDLAGALKQIVRDSSAYYLLGYSSSETPSDGKFHEIKVRVRRPGVDVRARKGYWALTAEETARAIGPRKPEPPAAIGKALGSIAVPPRGRTIRTWLGMTRGDDGRTRVTFVWEPIPAVPGERRDEPARVSLIAASDDGHAYFRGKVPDVVLASTDPSSAGSTAGPVARGPSRVTFDAEPGRLELRIAVEGSGSQVIDTDTEEVMVPDLTLPQVQLTTPRVLKAVNAVEFRSLTSNPDSVPVAGREFRRTERVLIRFDAYGPGSESPVLSARLLNRAGQSMSDLPVTSPPAGSSHQVNLPLAGLPPGEYLVEIRAKGESGEASELVPIRVVG